MLSIYAFPILTGKHHDNMSFIHCLYCKQKTDECPECNGAIEQRLTLPAAAFITALAIALLSSYSWYCALEKYEKAQAVRQIYLKKHPEADKKRR